MSQESQQRHTWFSFAPRCLSPLWGRASSLLQVSGLLQVPGSLPQALGVLFLLGVAYSVGVGEVLAQEASGAGGAAGTAGPGLDGFLQGLFRLLPLFGIVFFIFYFLVLRPQEAKEREHEALLKSAKNGTWLLTRGGIIGKLVASEEQALVLEIANGVRVRCEKGAIVREVEGLTSGHSSGKNKR